VRKHEANV